MKLRKLSAVMMAAILATSSPVSAYLGEITAFAKKDDDEEEEKDYSIGDAAWDTSEDLDGKTHVYATWSEAADKSTGRIVIYVDGKNRTSDASSGSISASTTSGKLELTKYIKKINREGEYTFKITAGKKNKGESETSSAESDTLEVDSDFLKSLSSSNSSSSSSLAPSGSSSSSSSSSGSSTSGSSPADAMKGGSQNSSHNSSQAPNQESTAADQWQNWAPYGWVYLENGIPVTNRWVTDNGKMYHIGANGFMDANTFVDDEYGHHYVGADGAWMY